ncbi:MAG: M13 family metallopeptidase [Candidatus Saccharimonadales bacterium]
MTTQQREQFDTSLRPQDDYFGYVNNPWLAANPIPPTESMWGAFYVLRDNAAEAVHSIMQELGEAKQSGLSHDQQLLKTYFDSALHYNSYATAHYNYLRELADEINAIESSRDIARVLGQMHRRDQSPLWTLYIDHDDKDSRMQVLRFHQSGLTLPNRDYYLGRDAHMRDVRQKYEAYFGAMHSHLYSVITSDFTTVMSIETELARASWTNVKLRDTEKNYNPITLGNLKKRYSFDWDAYFAALGWQSPNDHIVVSQPSFLRAATTMLDNRPLSEIKQYLTWQLLQGWAMWIDETATTITFDFFGRVINGADELKPLWKRAVQSADALIIGEAIGREYAARHFPESSKQAVLDIVEDIRAAYHMRIDRLTWMSDATKQRAHTKLDNIKVLIGYPSVWKDLSQLHFSLGNHLELLALSRTYRTDLELVKVGQPPADEQWEMNAHTVNAYHHPNRLEIVFPAAILQPPFYDPAASMAANLGGIGAVTGHEFTHGFDDQGADFDEHGNTNRWQTPAERAAFDALARHIVDQADAFETVPGVHLQGKLILGEAIADIGGLALAVEALRMKRTEKDFASQLSELFINFARCECAHARSERLIELAKIDPHPPSRFRVNCVVCHEDAFYEAYGVQPTDKLYLPADMRAQIW